MSDTKWADVAHYYSRSPITILNERGDEYDCSIAVSLGYLYLWKPILIHFEDITGDQAREFYTLKTGLPSKYVNRIIIRGKSADIVSVTYLKKFPAAKVIFVDIANKATPLGGQHTTKEFLWLISHGFDVFGLIESGQAIRKDVENG